MSGKKNNKKEASKEATKEAMRIQAEREFYTQNMKRMEEQIKNNLCDWSVTAIEERLAKIKSDFNKFEAKIKLVICGESDKEAKEAANTEFIQMEALLFNLVEQLKSRMSVLEMEKKKSSG